MDKATEFHIIKIIIIIATIGVIIGATISLYSVIKNYIAKYFKQKYLLRNLLILVSVIIKVDGKVTQLELSFVTNYFVNFFGKDKTNIGFKQFRNIVQKNISTEQTCKDIFNLLNYSDRLDFVEFLFQAAQCDKEVSQLEESEIKKIASFFYIKKEDYAYLYYAYFKSFKEYQQKSSISRTTIANEYEILGLSNTVSDSDIKKTYRKLVKKYHPDKLQDLPKNEMLLAKEKFQKIQKAYENIKNSRKF